MLLRPFLHDETSWASYPFGCRSHGALAIVDPNARPVDRPLGAADAVGHPIVAVRSRNPMLSHGDADAFATAPVTDIPTPPPCHTETVPANRRRATGAGA